MAVDSSAKKSNFISNVVAQATILNQVNNTLKALQLEYANQFAGGQSLVLADADFVGANGYMTAAMFSTFFSGCQGAVATAVTNNYQGLLAVLPQ